jgi:hypothetical protein
MFIWGVVSNNCLICICPNNTCRAYDFSTAFLDLNNFPNRIFLNTLGFRTGVGWSGKRQHFPISSPDNISDLYISQHSRLINNNKNNTNDNKNSYY